MRIYENPSKTSENRLPQRAHYIPSGKSEYRLLNGIWRFRYFSSDLDVPETIDTWNTIPVPSCWQTEGNDTPNYTNTNYPYQEASRQVANIISAQVILRPDSVLGLATGSSKAAIVRDAFWGPVTPQIPASILQLHPDFTLVADKEALACVKG